MTDVQSDAGAAAAADRADPTSDATRRRGRARRGRTAHIAERASCIASRRPKPTRVVAARVSIWLRLGELWRARELFVFLVRKEIKVKYKNSVLGFLWSMLNPALTLAVFYVLFTFFLPNGIPNFVIYMFSAMLVWNLFQTAVLTGTSTIVSNAAIVKKVAFPREILSLASVGSAFMFFLFQSIVLLVFMIAFWHRPDWSALWLVIPALAAIIVFAAALAVFLSAVNVYLRDTQHLVEVILMAWFWAIPGDLRLLGTGARRPGEAHHLRHPRYPPHLAVLRQPGDPGGDVVPTGLLQRGPSPLDVGTSAPTRSSRTGSWRPTGSTGMCRRTSPSWGFRSSCSGWRHDRVRAARGQLRRGALSTAWRRTSPSTWWT